MNAFQHIDNFNDSPVICGNRHRIHHLAVNKRNHHSIFGLYNAQHLRRYPYFSGSEYGPPFIAAINKDIGALTGNPQYIFFTVNKAGIIVI